MVKHIPHSNGTSCVCVSLPLGSCWSAFPPVHSSHHVLIPSSPIHSPADVIDLFHKQVAEEPISQGAFPAGMRCSSFWVSYLIRCLGEKWLHHEKIRDSHKREGTQKVVVGRGQWNYEIIPLILDFSVQICLSYWQNWGLKNPNPTWCLWHEMRYCCCFWLKSILVTPSTLSVVWLQFLRTRTLWVVILFTWALSPLACMSETVTKLCLSPLQAQCLRVFS